MQTAPTVQSTDHSRCKAMPVVFTTKETSNLENHFKPSPCPNKALRSVRNWYFDWNVEKCSHSHISICPGDEERLFANNLNSFRRIEDCLNGIFLLKNHDNKSLTDEIRIGKWNGY